MTDKRGPDDLVELVAKEIWSRTLEGYFADTHPEGFAKRTNAVRDKYREYAALALAAIEPYIQQCELAAKREVLQQSHQWLSERINELKVHRYAEWHVGRYSNNGLFMAAHEVTRREIERQLGELDAATTDTGEDAT